MLLKVQITASGTASINDGDTLTPLRAADLSTARALVTEHLTQMAREKNAAVITHLVEPDGEYDLCFLADGNVTMATSDQVENALNTPKLPETTPVAFSPEPDQDQDENKEIVDEPLGPDFFENIQPNQGAPTPQIAPAPALSQLDTPAPVSNTPAPMQVPTTPVVPTDFYQSPPTPSTQIFTNQPPQLPEQNQQFYPDAALNQPQPTANPVPGQPVQVSPPVLRPRPDSFLTQSAASGPKPTGWRAVAGRLGLKVQASQTQSQQWADERTVSQHWPGPRTIAVLNGKGGAGKTPTSILLASYFARLGSGSVVAADGNVTRGTLGWRTEQGPHNATILDMVPQTEALMDPSARNGDVAAYTHHQTIDQFDVLRSNPLLLSTEQKLTPEELDGIQQVLTRYYRMIIWDTGNDEGDSLWLRIVSHADQIVIATTTRTDHAEAGRLLLQGLSGRDERSAALAANAVVVISQADREEPPATSLVDGFAGIAREVVTIPYDRSMREQWLRSDKLAPATRAAWLHAAAAVARGL